MTYDAAGLGNHDFNFDLARLSAGLKTAPLPVLCSNLRRLDGGDLPLRRWLIIDRVVHGHPMKIGVFSVLPPQTLIWEADQLRGKVVIDDITETARHVVAELRAAGCSVVIALAHTGLGAKEEHPGQENAVWPLSRIDGLDAIVAGHTHRCLPDASAATGSDLARGLLNGTPVVMPGSGGSHLGQIDLDLVFTGAEWKISASSARLRAAQSREDAQLSAMTRDLHRWTRRKLSRPVGNTPVHLHTFFGLIQPCAAMNLIAIAKAHALQQTGLAPEGLPIIGSAAPARMGGRGGPSNYVDIPAGPLSLRDVLNLCYFPNRLAGVVVTGQQLRDWIDMSAGVYRQMEPGVQNQPLFHASRPAFGSDVFFGIDYALDLSKPARFAANGDLIDPHHSRVAALRHNGKSIADDDRFVIALSSYRANGGGYVHALRNADHLDLPHQRVRDALMAYLATGSHSWQGQQDSFRLCPLADTTARLQTGPGALDHLHELAAFYPTGCRKDAAGFLDLRITL
jgi:2',3'-cyclic-nucleotide 2'-phosphodiesterase/3'-nucleotidase